MAALSEDVLRKLITPNAKALSSPKGDKIVDEGRIGNINDFDDSMFLGETYNEPLDVQSNGGYLSQSTAAKARAMTDYSSNDFNPERVKNSKMLSAIKEEMVKNPIDTAALNAQMLESAAGGNPANNDRLMKMLSAAKRVDARASELDGKGMPKKQINERSAGGGIDYALIKTIVNECIETKFNEMAQRGVLNEGTTIKGIGLSNGKIKLVDNKGNDFFKQIKPRCPMA